MTATIEQIGAPLDLYDDPDNQFVAGFVGSPKMNFMPAQVVEARRQRRSVELLNHSGARLTQPLAGPRPQSGREVTVGVRPEHFVDAGKGDCRPHRQRRRRRASRLHQLRLRQDRADEELVIEREDRAATGDGTHRLDPAESRPVFDSAGQRLR